MIRTRRTGHPRRHRATTSSLACPVSVSDLLLHVASLPSADRAAARAGLEAALELPSPAARAALARLALELAVRPPGAAGHVLVLPATVTAPTVDAETRVHLATAERAGRCR